MAVNKFGLAPQAEWRAQPLMPCVPSSAGSGLSAIKQQQLVTKVGKGIFDQS